MAEPTINADALVALRMLVTCRSCGDAIWNLDLDDVSLKVDTHIGLRCARCGTHIDIPAPEAINP